jgi:pyruvate ferredoxin oxidoreductase beta subunit
MITKQEKEYVLNQQEIMQSGHNLCPGCPGGIAWRLITKVLGKSSILVHSASCYGNPVMIYPSSLTVPSLYVSFASASAAMSGVSAAIRILEKDGAIRERINLFVVAGDGGTADIGFASLSGAAERNEDIIYFCLDNEAYMNTGIQRSSETPINAWTTSTPSGKSENQKDMPLIMAAHKIPYVATASISYPYDLIKKIAKARDMGKGFKYIHVHTPCPTGWRFAENKTVEIGRLAVETGMWKLYEIENGCQKKITFKPQPRKPVTEYLKVQGRFGHLKAQDLDKVQKGIDLDCMECGL